MPESAEAIAREIVAKLQSSGFTAYFAGGCVRDTLLGRAPADYDVATSATPEQVQALFPHTVAVGAEFGVICVIRDRTTVQVASFRADGLYIDGRRPVDVTYSTPEQDARRRDFTVNGMFRDPIREEIIDFVEGRVDLEAKIIRAIGDPAARFREDHLRILRAIRFAATLGFEIEPNTWEALRAGADSIRSVSAERIREELIRIFVPPSRLRGFDLLDSSGLMEILLPEITALKGCEQPPQFHPEGDVYVHTRRMIELLPADSSLILVLSVLFHDIGKPPTFTFDAEADRIRFNGHDKVSAEMTRRIMERLRFSRGEIEAVIAVVENHMVFKDVQKMRVSRLKRFLARPHLEEELLLHKVDCESSHGSIENYDFLLQKKEEFSHEPLIPPPLITGRDLLALGWKPGPVIGQILEAVQTRQLEGALNTPEEALDWVKEEYRIDAG